MPRRDETGAEKEPFSFIFEIIIDDLGEKKMKCSMPFHGVGGQFWILLAWLASLVG